MSLKAFLVHSAVLCVVKSFVTLKYIPRTVRLLKMVRTTIRNLQHQFLSTSLSHITEQPLPGRGRRRAPESHRQPAGRPEGAGAAHHPAGHAVPPASRAEGTRGGQHVCGCDSACSGGHSTARAGAGPSP